MASFLDERTMVHDAKRWLTKFQRLPKDHWYPKDKALIFEEDDATDEMYNWMGEKYPWPLEDEEDVLVLEEWEEEEERGEEEGLLDQASGVSQVGQPQDSEVKMEED